MCLTQLATCFVEQRRRVKLEGRPLFRAVNKVAIISPESWAPNLTEFLQCCRAISYTGWFYCLISLYVYLFLFILWILPLLLRKELCGDWVKRFFGNFVQCFIIWLKGIHKALINFFTSKWKKSCYKLQTNIKNKI